MMPLEQSSVRAGRGVRLGELVRALPGGALEPGAAAELEVSGVRHDSRAVQPGELFVARRGRVSDGAEYARQAVARGAVAVVAEHAAELGALGVPVLRVEDARAALATLAERVYGSPSRALSVAGITGTNGKTTTAVLVADALGRLGARAASLGTLGFTFAGTTREGSHTTPEADDVSRVLAELRDAGGTHCVMEVSSHALEQRRVAALEFAVGAFTNLTQDHLDYHGSMQRYAEAKARLFTELSPRSSVVNVGDPFGAELVRRIAGERLTVARDAAADLRVERCTIDARGIHAALSFRGTALELESRLVGEHNLDNLLVALGVLLALDFPPLPAADALGRAAPAPGRLERCDGPGDELVVLVDYAHTPDALARVLRAARALTAGQLWCVFGCGGDRDPDKRPKMGRAVGEAADRAIVTNDNPRSEPPEAIARAIEPALAASGSRYEIELDRAVAIERAVLAAAPGDCVVIAGKGHENYQLFATGRVAFDDRREARRALSLRRAGRGRS